MQFKQKKEEEKPQGRYLALRTAFNAVYDSLSKQTVFVFRTTADLIFDLKALHFIIKTFFNIHLIIIINIKY